MAVAPFVRALVLVLAALASGCSPDRAPANVVLVLVDELRKDTADDLMTGVNAAAQRGVIADEMRSAAPWTYPSVVSLMSGLYPQQHGADGHLHENTLSRIDSGVPLLHQQLREAGYATAAFVTNPFLLEWNDFHVGFDSFDGSFIGSQANRRGDESVWKPQTMFANHVNAAVRAHFDAKPLDAPEFTYIHYIDVHGPWSEAPFRPDYAEAVAYVDRKIMEIYDRAMQRYDGNLLFIVTSDHGRALGDDLRVGDGRAWRKQKHSVHDYNLRIPFSILPSAIVPEGVRVTGPTSNIDVVPTVLEWLGLPSHTQRPGISLLAAIRGGEPVAADRLIYARNAAFGELNDALLIGQRKELRFFDIDTGRIAAHRTYDLSSDPRETRSLPDGDPQVSAAQFEAAAGDHGLRFEVRFDGVEPIIEDRLRALGYLGGVEADPATPQAPDPD